MRTNAFPIALAFCMRKVSLRAHCLTSAPASGLQRAFGVSPKSSLALRLKQVEARLARTCAKQGAAQARRSTTLRVCAESASRQQSSLRCSCVCRATSRHTGVASASSEWALSKSGGKQAWLRTDLHLVLVNPVIPQNVGNIARTCAATGVGLHLVAPLGFEIDDRRLKRAGLDYWPYVAVQTHESWEAFADHFEALDGPKRMLGFSKFASRNYAYEGLYRQGDWLIFGAETTGLPAKAHELIPQLGGEMLKIPMREAHVRSLNLSVAVGVGVFEAIRQLDGAQPAA